VLLQGALVVRHGHPAVADAFCTSGSPATTGPPRGTLAPGLDLATIVERATPRPAETNRYKPETARERLRW
jgi:putative acyl-CoA dehydrogenase